MAKSKKSPAGKVSHAPFKELIVPGNLFSKEYGVIVIEVSKGTQSFYYVVNILKDTSSSFNPLFEKFAIHLKVFKDAKYVFFNKLMAALKISKEEELFSWLWEATIKFLFYKTDQYVHIDDWRKFQPIHREKILKADAFAELLIKELSLKYKRNQILNFQKVSAKKQKLIPDKMANKMIKMLNKKSS